MELKRWEKDPGRGGPPKEVESMDEINTPTPEELDAHLRADEISGIADAAKAAMIALAAVAYQNGYEAGRNETCQPGVN